MKSTDNDTTGSTADPGISGEATTCPKRLKLEARGRELIRTGTQWLTVGQLQTLTQGTAASTAGVHKDWEDPAQLLWIEFDGVNVCPRYAFDKDMTLRPVIAEVLALFAGWKPLAIVGWFESTSSFLSGNRPRELLGTDPAMVVEAARDAVLPVEAVRIDE